ncbi:actin-related protein 5-like isoform X2 [Corticium candelabrum]|uniref:actin-related protein 5-like isoform X2 n=1 Tax=Corticium candelabrum TaxID=121492 RepID=UPI002E26A605|nr:actin-related protein 5-like isoform X2 [Corticium candelabrum]
MGEPLYTFKDEFPDPDLISSDYEQFEDTKVPIVIDNGSFHCRAGWASESSPRLIFRNLSAKSKGKRDLELSSVGNNIGNLETVRWALRTQFDRNVVTHFEAQELVFDYIFSHLGIYTSGHVDHPIVITEPVCNPNYCRNLMSELLFECYHVPSVAYGIDGLFSLYYNQSQSRNALVINSGFQSTHILPVLNGKLYASQAKRINVGGNHVISFMQRLLQLKHPAHLQAVTLSRAQELVHDFTYMAVDFMAELNEWKGGAVPDGKLIKIQLPYTELPLMDPEELAQKEEREQERRQTQAQRLREMTSRKRLEKLSELEQQLEYWMSVQAMEDENLDEFYVVLGQLEFESSKDLQSAIDRHRASIEKIQMAIAASEARYEQENEEPTTKRLKDDTSDEPGPVSEQWLKSIRARRQSLIESRQQRQQRRQQLANRRSHASKERMRLIAELAHDDQSIFEHQHVTNQGTIIISNTMKTLERSGLAREQRCQCASTAQQVCLLVYLQHTSVPWGKMNKQTVYLSIYLSELMNSVIWTNMVVTLRIAYCISEVEDQ